MARINCLLVTSTLCLVLVACGAQTDGLCGEWEVNPETGKLYGQLCVLRTWEEARIHCQKHGADLPSIHSAQENEFLQSLVRDSNWLGRIDRGTWLGLNDRKTEGTFIWSDNSAVDFINWANGEPNDAHSFIKEDCTEMYKEGPWNDIPCSKTNHVICEKKGNIESDVTLERVIEGGVPRLSNGLKWVPGSMIECSASSEYSREYRCERAFDGIACPDWASKGEGEGAWIEAKFSNPVLVKEIKFLQRDGLREQNKKIEIEFDGNTKLVEELPVEDAIYWNVITLKYPIKTSTMRITVREVYSKFNNGFKEIAVYGSY